VNSGVEAPPHCFSTGHAGQSEQQLLAGNSLAELDKKWAANHLQVQNLLRMAYSSSC
jgi:hypothetical protein